MDAIFHFWRFIERRLGNTWLGLIAGAVFFLSVSGAVSQWNTGSSHKTTAARTTTTVVVTTSSSVAAATTTSVAASTTVTTSPAVVRNGLAGYAAVTFSVTPEAKNAQKFCGLLASSSDQQAAGLMNRSDLGGYDGMIFPFPNDTSVAFYMANVPVALSVAWFDKDGKFLSSADMEPCKVERLKCPLYKAVAPYRTALETLKGGLGNLGIGSGSVLGVAASGPC